jgi:hypothetical protein
MHATFPLDTDTCLLRLSCNLPRQLTVNEVVGAIKYGGDAACVYCLASGGQLVGPMELRCYISRRD